MHFQARLCSRKLSLVEEESNSFFTSTLNLLRLRLIEQFCFHLVHLTECLVKPGQNRNLSFDPLKNSSIRLDVTTNEYELDLVIKFWISPNAKTWQTCGALSCLALIYMWKFLLDFHKFGCILKIWDQKEFNFYNTFQRVVLTLTILACIPAAIRAFLASLMVPPSTSFPFTDIRISPTLKI